MPDTTGHATDNDVEALRKSVKESNEDRKRDKLQRKAHRAHEWRVQVWAQSELAMQAANAELEILGSEPYMPYTPDFSSPDMLTHYASMTLPK